MGLVLDSSVLITAERNGDSVAQILGRALGIAGNQETAISSIALVELAHGIFQSKYAGAATEAAELYRRVAGGGQNRR
jgi:predicted nucleic acid-binding protein